MMAIACVVLAIGDVGGLGAQEGVYAEPGDTVGISLEMAVGRALGESQEIQLARSRVALADAQIGAARSLLFPQINANVGYTKTFASAFDTGGGGFELPDSL